MPFVASLDELKSIVAQERKKGKRIVTTNGCFDLLHLGHVRYLQEAQKLGDLLIVGINSDESVRRLKGENRPLNSETDRAEVVAALRWVDYTFVFREDNPVRFVEELKPDVHAKGGDYTLDRIIERKAVEAGGGKVVLLGMVKGKSTTGLINQFKDHRT